MRGILRAAVAVAIVTTAAPVSAAPPRTSAEVRTTVAGAPLPSSPVEARWTSPTELEVSGVNLPATETTVTAAWEGTARVGRDGTLATLTQTFTSGMVDGAATADVLVEYLSGRRWVRAATFESSRGTRVSTYMIGAFFLTRVGTYGVRPGRVVPLRVRIVARYAEPSPDLDEAFGIAPAS